MSSTLVLAPLLLGLAQEPAADASAILAQVWSNFGEPARLSKIENRRYSGLARWRGMDGEGGTFTETFAGLRKGLIVTDFDGFGRFSLGTDGTTVWEKSPGTIQVKRGWDAAADVRRFGMLQHVPWRELYASAVVAGEATIDGVPCHRLELRPRALVPMDEAEAQAAVEPDVWFVDRQTHLPLQIDVWAKGPTGEVLELKMHLRDWKVVDGVRYPHVREIEVSGFVLILEYTRFEHDVELDPSTFVVPADVLAAAKAPAPKAPPEEITIVELEQRPTCSVRVTCKEEDLTKTFAVILPETFRHVLSSGARASQPFARYHVFGEEIDVEAGIMLDEAIPGAGRVKASSLPGGKTAAMWHVGPYDKLGESHARLVTWMEKNGWEASSGMWEEYWTDPGMEPDSSKWRTRILQPVRKK